MTAANIIPTALTDGIPYATAVPLTPTEAVLGDALLTPAIIPIAEGQTIVAVVKLNINGVILANSTFIFLQTDLGDGTWVDIAWCAYAQTQAPLTFVLCGGGLGAMNNAFQQRLTGNPPTVSASGSNAMPLGARCRFTGYSRASGGSSSAPGLTTQVTATIIYKIQEPR